MTDQIAWAGKVSFAGSVMLAGLLSQSYDTRKPSVFVDFPLLKLISFSGKPQAEANLGTDATGLSLKRLHQNPACDLRSRQMLSAFRRSVDEFQNENSIRQHGYLDCL